MLAGYSWRRGTGTDRALLVKFMQRTYQELYPDGSFAHLAQTVEQYFSPQTPLWWIETANSAPAQPTPVGCLWLGSAIDQTINQQYGYIFLLYVSPAHRRCGLGAALIHHAEAWSAAKGHRQIGLQVFEQNQPARNLYEKLGFRTQSVLMVKSLGTQ
jgi:ribosomal protein S18 acetylase RimI-like enzyme